MLHVKQFGRYEIVSKLGRGMTDVYLAIDPTDNHQAVLKIVEKSSDPWTQTVLEAERRGALIQKQLHDADPRFPQIYESGDVNGYYFVAMQYVEGQSVAELLRAEGRLDPAIAARYAMEVAGQLARLHSFEIEIDGRKRAVVHGDIKPSNIQICPDGQICLLDFGIAKSITFTRNLTFHNLGSPNYCSPERLRRAQVDPQSDLWALGATLYEMVAGFPPYQAQSTQKLEELIRSKRPPRALPQDCPEPLKAVTRKMLSGEIENRYPSAAAVEEDLERFLAGRATLAETEKLPAWEAHPTVEKNHAAAREARKALHDTAEFLRRLWDPIAARLHGALDAVQPARKTSRRLVRFLRRAWIPIAAVALGGLVGALVYIEAAYAYRFWSESKPIRGFRDYTHRTIDDINADWNLYQSLQRRNLPLGRFSPAAWLSQTLRSSYLAAADDVIERYRNSSDPEPGDFEWRKAQVCLEHSAALDGTDFAAKGKLALVKGYLALLERPQSDESEARANAGFEEALLYLPKSPDPHLALARLDVYGFRNVGRAVAEFADAERLGFKPGPREFEQQADGYLFHAEHELQQAQRPGLSKPETAKYLLLARDNLERARNLYEPIAGYSNVSSNLDRLYRDRAKQEALQSNNEKPVPVRKPPYRRRRSWR